MADPRLRRYSDPRVGAAFEELGSVFAPPSAQDLYAGSRARATDADARRKAEVYARATAPGASIQSLDLPAIAAGLYTPVQSGYAVDTEADTKRRGQDIDLQGKKYDVDSRDSTSRANNTADNKTRLQTSFGAPVPKDATQFVDPETAKALGISPGPRSGVVAAAPGEVNYIPGPSGQAGGGGVLVGNEKPKTTDEVNAETLQTLPPEVRAAVAAKDMKLEDVIMADGKVTPMTGPQRLAAGASAAPDKNAQIFNSDVGPVRYDPVRRSMVSVTTGQPVAVKSLQAPSGVQSKDPLGPTTANSSEANSKEAGLNVLDKLTDEYEALLKANPGIVGIPGAVRGAAQNIISSAQEFSAAFGNLSPDAKLAADQVASVAARLSANRDPAIVKATVMKADLAYKWAQAQNPRGEVSRQAFERAMETLSGGGGLTNNQSELEGLSAVRDFSKRERIGVSSLRNPGGAPPTGRPRMSNPQTGEVVEWDGNAWVKVQ